MEPVSERAILTALKARDQLSVTELADYLDAHPVSVDRRCYTLQQNGYIRQVTSGTYMLTKKGTKRLVALNE